MALRLAVVGLGDRGRQWAREIATSPLWDLVACVELDEAAVGWAADELSRSGAQCYTDLSAALDARACDAVVVATPPDRHVEPCQSAIERGLGVLVEKPFTTSFAEAADLVDAAERGRVPLVVGQNLRYTRAHQTVRRLIRDGALGEVRMVICQSYRVPELSGWRQELDELLVWEVAVHHLDVLRYTIGELAGVMAESFGSSLHSMLAFEGGARGLYSATYESSGHEFFERGQEFYERVVGDRATLHVLHRWLVLCPRGGRPRLVRRGRRPMTEEHELLRQLAAALGGGEEPDSSGRENLATMAAVEACARSAADGRWADPRDVMATRV